MSKIGDFFSGRWKNHLLSILTITLLLVLSLSVFPLHAQSSGVPACAVTPNMLGGQGFNVSGQGFNVSGQGFNVSGQGFNVSGQGFNVSGQGLDPLVVAQEIIDNGLPPSEWGNWIDDRLDLFLNQAGFNTDATAIIIIDEFSPSPDAHGFLVKQVVDASLNRVRAQKPDLKIDSFSVDITGAYEADAIAQAIDAKVRELRDTDPRHYKRFILNMSFGLIACEGTPVVNGQELPTFNFDDAINTVNANNSDTPSLAVEPILECIVQVSYHNYVAYFGYKNDNAESISKSIGTNNRFYNSPSQDRGQPYFFEPGRQSFVFAVPFTKTDALTWKLKGPDNTWHVATATRFSTQCGSSGAPPAPAPVNQPITPILECVSDAGEGMYEARFGYNNPNQQGVKISVGTHNQFTPYPKDRGQVITFAPGLHEAVFEVYFDGSNLTWTVAGVTSANANVNTDSPPPACPEAQGFGISQYLTQNLDVPEDQVDDYWNQLSQPIKDDELQSLRQLLHNYLQSSGEAFSATAVASSGNLKPFLGSAPLAPASWTETIAVGAILSTTGEIWDFSQNADVVAPGVSYQLTEGGNSFAAGTSFAAPLVSVLTSLCATVPDALSFENGRPPLDPSAFNSLSGKNLQNLVIGTDDFAPLACDLNTAQEVVIDIKPLSNANRINLRSWGKIGVAILSSSSFDAPREVNPRTVTLAGAPALKWHGIPIILILDVNHDRRRDLVLYFRVQDLQLTSTSTQAELEGQTYAGETIHGVDSVTIVPPHAPRLTWPRSGNTMSTRVFSVTWDPVDEEEEANTCFLVQIDNNSNFASPEQTATVVRTTSYSTFTLPNGNYFWRVAVSDCASSAVSPWSETWQFTVRGR